MVDPACEIPTLSILCDIYDPVTKQRYTPRPALHRRQGGGVPQDHRHRRHALLGPRARVLHLSTTSASSPDSRPRYYYIDSDEGSGTRGATRAAEPRLQAAQQGRLLPGAAHRLPAGPAQRDDPEDDRRRHRDRAPAPRGRHRRPGRDRLPLRHPGQNRGPRDDVQVHRQERRPRPRQGRDLHAEAPLRRQRLRHAHPPEPVEGRQHADVRRKGALRQHQRHLPLVHRRPAAARGRRSSPSPRRPPTATSAWCPASRRR